MHPVSLGLNIPEIPLSEYVDEHPLNTNAFHKWINFSAKDVLNFFAVFNSCGSSYVAFSCHFNYLSQTDFHVFNFLGSSYLQKIVSHKNLFVHSSVHAIGAKLAAYDKRTFNLLPLLAMTYF